MEGPKPILEILRGCPESIQTLVVTPSFLHRTSETGEQILAGTRGRVYSCRETAFEKLSHLETSQGILAILRKPRWAEQDCLDRSDLLGLYGEGLQDPTNVGTILRTAAAMNLSAIWLTADSVDVFSPKIVRATAGTVMTLPVFRIGEVSSLLQRGCTLFAADSHAHGAVGIRTIKRVPARAVLAFGNESRGLSDSTLRQATTRFHIPIARHVESLNVAASAAIAMYYFASLPQESSDE